MPNGYQQGAVCFPTVKDAAQAYVNTLPPVSAVTQTNCPFMGTYLVSGTADRAWVQVYWSKVTGGTCNTVLPSSFEYYAVPCSIDSSPFHLSLEDGASIAGAVAAVWVSAWCLKALARALNTDGTPEREIP